MDNYSSAIWTSSELEMDNDHQRLNLIQQYQNQMINNIDADLYDQESSFHGFAANYSFTSNSESYSSEYPTLITEIKGSTTDHNAFQPAGGVAEISTIKDLIIINPTSISSSAATPMSSSSSNIICFANPPKDQEENPSDDSLEFSELLLLRAGAPYCSSRSPLQAQDHVLNERKRREKMAKQFVALSAIIPNKKKMDKASILGEAMRYIKELQERVKELEREERSRNDIESFVSVKRTRYQSSGDDDHVSSSEENSHTAGHDIHFTRPEIEVRVSGANVLVKIHCHKRSGLLLKALEEIQKHRLSIVSSNAMPFADSTLLIDIIAQMEEDDMLMTANELAEKLELAIYS